MNYKDQLEQILSQAVTEKTFSLEIIEKIKTLKEGFEQETRKNETLGKEIESLIESHNKGKELIDDLKTKLTKLQDREKVITEKEKLLEKNAYELVFQQNRANEIKELFSIVFKNPTTRESVIKNSQTPVVSNGYVQTHNTKNEETKTTESE